MVRMIEDVIRHEIQKLNQTCILGIKWCGILSAI